MHLHTNTHRRRLLSLSCTQISPEKSAGYIILSLNSCLLNGSSNVSHNPLQAKEGPFPNTHTHTSFTHLNAVWAQTHSTYTLLDTNTHTSVHKTSHLVRAAWCLCWRGMRWTGWRYPGLFDCKCCGYWHQSQPGIIRNIYNIIVEILLFTT